MIRYAARPGETTKNDGQPMEIVGIAAPIRDDLFDREAGPAFYEPWGRNYRGNMFLHVRAAQAGTEAELLQAIRREMRAYDPKLPVLQATTMTAFHDRQPAVVGRPRRRAPVPGLRRARAAARGRRALRREVRTSCRSARARSGSAWRSARGRGDVLAMMLSEGAALAAVGVALGLPLAALLGFAREQHAVRRQAARPGRLRHARRPSLATGRAGRDLAPRPPRHPRHPPDRPARGLEVQARPRVDAPGSGRVSVRPQVADRPGSTEVPAPRIMRGCDGSGWRSIVAVSAYCNQQPRGRGRGTSGSRPAR